MSRSMNGPFSGMMKSRFDIGQLSPIKYFFGISFILGILFAFISNQEDGIRPFYQIILQWQLQTVLPITLLIFSHMMLSRWRLFEQANRWLQLVLSGVVGIMLFTPLALWLDHIFVQDVSDQGRLFAHFVDELFGVGPPVLISWVAMNVPWLLGYRIKQVSDEEPAVDAEASSALKGSSNSLAILQQLPAAIRSDVVSLKSELHYIEVTTTSGQALVLYNLKDAMLELDAVSGIQTHRSYWVNLNHIERFSKQGRQGVLTMSNGQQIPVSRNRLAAVIDACTGEGKQLN